MSITATQSHSAEHLGGQKAECNPEICLEKKFHHADMGLYTATSL